MSKNIHRIYVGSFFLISIIVSVLLGINGYQYYSTSVEERVFLLQHSALKPSGLIGHGVGIIGSLMMIIGVAIYMIRKRTKLFLNLGFLKYWLELHIFLCTLGPILVLYHTAFKFGGIVAVSFWSMTAVVLSGVVGRFLYVQIPRTIQGHQINLNELNEINDNLTVDLKTNFNLSENILGKVNEFSSSQKYKHVTFRRSFIFLLKDYFGMRSLLKELKAELKRMGIDRKDYQEILKASKAKLIISKRIGMLRTMQKLFKHWHIVHLPFAITMFVIMFIHVGVTIAFGYKWIF